MALGHGGAPMPKQWEGARWEGQEARTSKDRACLWPDQQHTPQPACHAVLQSPIKARSKRITGALESQILVTVTLAGAVPCRPQAGSLQTYPASSKAGAQVPYTLKGHVT